jgi:alpha-beta hydrolase superfamily lysophospholipase
LVRLVVWVSAVYGVVLLLLLALEDRLVFHPVSAAQRWIDPPPGYMVREIGLQTEDGTRLHARWYPCEGSRGAVLICHSRAGNVTLECRARDLEGWHREVGVSVLIFDYPGYGRSEGRPSEAGCYAAAEAAYQWLTDEKGLPADQVVLYGRSLGSAVAVDLASRRPHRALILVSPFTSLPDVVHHLYPVLPAEALMRNRFPSLAKIGRCTQPVFMVHGTADRQVPFELGQELFAAANEPKRFLAVEGAHHGDCLTAAFFPAVHEFLARKATKGTRK